MAPNPVVDGIQTRHQGELTVIRVNIQDPSGRAIADRYQLSLTPSFLFFSNDGEILWRAVGAVDPGQVAASLGGP